MILVSTIIYRTKKPVCEKGKPEMRLHLILKTYQRHVKVM